MSSLAIWPTLTCTFAATHTTRKSIQFGAYYSDTMGFDMTAFLQNETCGLKKFEELLSDEKPLPTDQCLVKWILFKLYGPASTAKVRYLRNWRRQCKSPTILNLITRSIDQSVSQSTTAPDSLTTLVHFVVSVLINSPS